MKKAACRKVAERPSRADTGPMSAVGGAKHFLRLFQSGAIFRTAERTHGKKQKIEGQFHGIAPVIDHAALAMHRYAVGPADALLHPEHRPVAQLPEHQGRFHLGGPGIQEPGGGVVGIGDPEEGRGLPLVDLQGVLVALVEGVAGRGMDF